GRDPPERMTVASLVEEARILCRARIEAHGVTLSVDIPSDAPIEGSCIELSQVLVNLLNNAVDAARTAPGGWVRLSVDAAPGRPSVSIVVEDSGPGVPKDAAESIFRSFFTTKKSGEGTGLGLSISRSIVERHGGTLTCETSAPHTRFVVVLPRPEP
ncbi:MAG TPA: HAMP domain-containing sensor histidine kinase, partial [Labilithrix sp.]|nr:HAMP domain-containing sensor histidine kinase [Labilithrix sp.]